MISSANRFFKRTGFVNRRVLKMEKKAMMLCAAVTVMLGVQTRAFADAQCLSEATNQELTNEIASRLETANGSASGAIVSYYCDTRGTLHASIVGPTGTEEESTLDSTDTDYCHSIADLVSSTRSVITHVQLIATCFNGREIRVAITPAGTHTLLPYIEWSDASACKAAVLKINQ